MDVVIGPERATEHAAVRDVVRRAFTDQPAVADLVDLLRASPGHRPDLALVARLEGRVVGFVLLTPAGLEGPDGTRHDVLTLSPLAVATEHQHVGTGSALVRAGVAAAERTPYAAVTLEGSPGFYGRLGFEPAAELGITMDLPGWAPPEAAQARALPCYDPTARGRLVLPPAFAAID